MNEKTANVHSEGRGKTWQGLISTETGALQDPPRPGAFGKQRSSHSGVDRGPSSSPHVTGSGCTDLRVSGRACNQSRGWSIDLAEAGRPTPDKGVKAQRNLGFDISGPGK
jgi:hypothetical protein